MKRRDIYFLLAVAAVVGLLWYLSSTGHERFISRIEPHVKLVGIKDTAAADAQCLSCHGDDAAKVQAPPMPSNHPLRKKNCRQCHRLERSKP
jgi:hypothetical protein